MGPGEIRSLHQRLQRALHLRRTGPRRHPSGQVGCQDSGKLFRRYDGRRSRSCAMGPSDGRETFSQSRLRGRNALRPRQRNRWHRGQPQHPQVVQGRAPGPCYGSPARYCTPRNGLCDGPCTETRSPADWPRLQPCGMLPSGPRRDGAYGLWPNPLGRFRGNRPQGGRGSFRSICPYRVAKQRGGRSSCRRSEGRCRRGQGRRRR